ncbi:hypothetical protein WZ342_2284 [Enterococcus faecalis]|nr:hypothetical protein WZ342_2284 [Enterococcus faecalis]
MFPPILRFVPLVVQQSAPFLIVYMAILIVLQLLDLVNHLPLTDNLS